MRWTVVFEGEPTKGNPFDVVSEFGKVMIVASYDACEALDVAEEYIGLIEERPESQAKDLAKDAAAQIDTIVLAGINAMRRK